MIQLQQWLTRKGIHDLKHFQHVMHSSEPVDKKMLYMIYTGRNPRIGVRLIKRIASRLAEQGFGEVNALRLELLNLVVDSLPDDDTSDHRSLVSSHG